MKSWWSTMFGGTTLINDGMELIDNSFYTDEEKGARKVELLKAYHPFKLIQRFLSMWITVAFMVVLALEIGLVLLGMWFPFLIEAVPMINSLVMVEMLGWSFVAVISLYFTGGVINSFKERVTK